MKTQSTSQQSRRSSTARFRSSSKRKSSLLSNILLVAQLPCLVSAALPKVDFDRMGHVGLAGTFAGLDLFEDSTSPLALDPSTSTLLSRASDGSLTRLGSTNTDGRMNTGCALGDTYFFAGLFSSINGTTATNVASFSASSQSFSALGGSGDAPNGEVNAIFCDEPNKRVWVGGRFSSPASSVAIWSTDSNSWSAPPFGGLGGGSSDVRSITTNSSASSLFFSGSFITAFGSNITVNGTNNPNVTFSPGATPFSSSLVPIPLQGAQIDAAPSSLDPNFSDINTILCPTGDDGPGQTWLARDGFKPVITVRAFRQLDAMGIRLGNTFLSDRGTVAFSLTSIPDNNVQTLTYFDPTTGTTQTCSDRCPLLQDPLVPYQDFLFASDISITGFQLTLTEAVGSGAGLHILQLLSSGAFASAVAARNQISCFAPNPSNVTLVGAWTENQVTTDIAGTLQDILLATVPVGTPSSSAPSITWMPYVSATGNYIVNMLIPGCIAFPECDARTSVEVTVFPGGDLPPVTVTFSQRVTDSVVQRLYEGPIFPTTPDFVATITMRLADSPEGTGVNGNFEIVADRVELRLESVDFGSDGSNGGLVDTTLTKRGFGFFEWPLNAEAGVNAVRSLPNTSETALDAIGFQFFQAVGGNSGVTGGRNVISTVAHHSSGAILLGGTFSISTGSNIVMFRNGALTQVANNGLNGPVNSIAIVGDVAFVGGSFTDLTDGSTGGNARGVAAYNIATNSWSSLGNGVNGAVTSVSFANGQVAITGDFTDESEGSTRTGGLAVWNINNSTFGNTGGFLIGSMTFVGNGTAPSRGTTQGQFLAGSVSSVRKFGATGFMLLQNGEDDVPIVSPLSVRLQDNIDGTPTTSTTSRRKRSASSGSVHWLRNLRLTSLFKRQSTSTVEPLPPPPAAPAPAVLTGGFWTNSSSSQDVAILGGNFSFVDGVSGTRAEGVAIYDLKSGGVKGLSGNPVDGVVRAVLVDDETLYVGGEFSVSGGSGGSGFLIYNLARQELDVTGLQPLTGDSVVVRSLTKSASKENTVIVAGSFTSAGGVSCVGICQLDTTTKQWSALGEGIVGEVSSVAYGGNSQDLLFASGSIALQNGVPANVAMFSFANSTWVPVGSGADIPGPVTAVTVDNGNSSSIFAAGRSSDGSQSFLSFWNGLIWTPLNPGFDSSSDVSQLAFVPLQDTHEANSIIEQDRMLMLTGSMVSSSFGNASSVLYDGQSFIPYIATSDRTGEAGFVSSLFTSISNFSFAQRKFLATGVVILISIAIAAGVVFLMVLIGILWALFARNDNNDRGEYQAYDDDDSTQHNPTSLLEHVQAATVTMLGTGAPSPFDKGKDEDGRQGEAYTNDADDYAGLNNSSEGRRAYARYSFEGDREGELPLHGGVTLEILDDSDKDWWYARNLDTGREGVVPSAYVI